MRGCESGSLTRQVPAARVPSRASASGETERPDTAAGPRHHSHCGEAGPVGTRPGDSTTTAPCRRYDQAMGPGAVARALIRAAYRLVRFPLHLVGEVVLPVIFDEEAPVRRAYGKFLRDCVGAAAYILADDTAAVHAAFLRRRSAAFHDAIARHPSSIHTESEVVMEHHRARFRERRRVTYLPTRQLNNPPAPVNSPKTEACDGNRSFFDTVSDRRIQHVRSVGNPCRKTMSKNPARGIVDTC